jgi:hypothetical protein
MKNPIGNTTPVQPNLLIIGAQKCGTTWLHQALEKSDHFQGSRPKELNFWNRPRGGDFEKYKSHFRQGTSRTHYWYESTPVYFRMPDKNWDVAAKIREGLGDIPLILLLRNPTERYLSAYTHHMMRGRLKRDSVIDNFTNEFRLLSLGRYSKILRHYQKYFSRINIYLHDDMKHDNLDFVKNIFNALNVPFDLEQSDLDFRANAKELKVDKFGWNPDEVPIMSESLKDRLNRFYYDDVRDLSAIISRDLSSWLK